jgi:hypothetical protein
MSYTPGFDEFDFVQMDPSTAPFATGAAHRNAAIVSVNQPLAVRWLPKTIVISTPHEVKTPHASWWMMMTNGHGIDLAFRVTSEVDDAGVFEKCHIVDDGGLQSISGIFFLIDDEFDKELSNAMGYKKRNGAGATKT